MGYVDRSYLIRWRLDDPVRVRVRRHRWAEEVTSDFSTWSVVHVLNPDGPVGSILCTRRPAQHFIEERGYQIPESASLCVACRKAAILAGILRWTRMVFPSEDRQQQQRQAEYSDRRYDGYD